MTRLHRRTIRSLHDRMLAAYGEQGWWPANTAFEVVVGAVLTQNTAWINVERALARLHEAGVMSAQAMLDLAPGRLAGLIRPSGYYNVKTRRLRAVCRFIVEYGGIDELASRGTDELREALLGVHGIGRETADDIVLYGFHRPVFVIDAYTRRIFSRLGYIDGNEGYETLRAAFERALPADTALYKEYHALIVCHAKEVCAARPRCESCCLQRGCAMGGAKQAAD